MKTCLTLLASAALTMAAACAPTAQPATPAATPTTAQACAEAGGDWRREGRMQTHRCVVTYADAGATCRDSDDCQGECRLAEGLDPAALTGPATGVCQADSSPFGCFTRVEDGRAEPTLCVD